MRSAGGCGISPFELAGPERSTQILSRWGSEGRRAARISLALDFPFLVAYTALGVRLTGRACDLLGSRAAPRLARLGPAVVAVQIIAGACDAIENAALLGVVSRNGDPKLASVARRAARAKFAGLIVGWMYGAAALIRR